MTITAASTGASRTCFSAYIRYGGMPRMNIFSADVLITVRAAASLFTPSPEEWKKYSKANVATVTNPAPARRYIHCTDLPSSFHRSHATPANAGAKRMILIVIIAEVPSISPTAKIAGQRILLLNSNQRLAISKPAAIGSARNEKPCWKTKPPEI